jgi:hypothetical protein
MRRAIAALAWEIGARNRRLVWLVLGILLFAWMFNALLPDAFQATKSLRESLLTINCLLMSGSLLLVFGIFTCTEANAQREWTGFPYRLFALPVSTLVLAAVPVCLGVASVELLYLAWLKLVFVRQEIPSPGWPAALLGAYLVFYQTILWSLARFRMARIIVLSLVGTSSIGVACLPGFSAYLYFASPWLGQTRLTALLAGLSVAAFLVALASLHRQRTGGAHGHRRLRGLLDRARDLSPQRRSPFHSGAAAQFWFEWQRSGWLLPACVGAALLFVIGPLSWHLRANPEHTLWILGWTLAMPVLCALPIGKGLSKPDLWSPDLGVPSFDAVRPLASGEMAVIKLKVAALSATLAWSLVLAFLALWLPLWADLAELSLARIGFWMVYHHTVAPQYATAALIVIAAMLLTWKCLVSGLWVGLSGSRKLFVTIPACYVTLALTAMIVLLVIAQHDDAYPRPVPRDPNRIVQWLQWIGAAAVIAKVWLAAWSWRQIAPSRVRRFTWLWCGAVVCLLSLALLLWARGALVLLLGPLEPERFRNLLILAALLAVPFARVGLAPSFFARNRHGGGSGAHNSVVRVFFRSQQRLPQRSCALRSTPHAK